MPAVLTSYVELADLFPGSECTLEHLAVCLRALPLDEALVMCARANQIVSAPGSLSRTDRQRKLANALLSREAGTRLNNIVQKRGQDDLEKTALFFRAQLLELVRWVLAFCTRERAPADFRWTQVEKDAFVQAALISSLISEGKVLAALHGGASVATLKDIALVFFRSALDAGLIAPDPYRVIGRGQQLFLEYLPEHYPDLDRDFRQATDMSLDEYMRAAGALSAIHLQLDDGMVLSDAVTLGSDTEYAEVYRAYRQLQVWGIDDLRERLWPGGRIPMSLDEVPAFDLKPLREKPIIALNDGRGVIPDAALLADSMTIGPIFHLTRARVRDDNYIFGRFGDAFEEYACDLLGRMFPQGAGLHQRLRRKVPGVEADGNTFEIDACLDYLDTLVVIEAKAVFISDAAVIACDERAFRAELERKYLRGDREVGVAQLARVIRSLAVDAWAGPGTAGAVEFVYPALVVHDRLLVEPLVTKLLAEMLISELGASQVPSSWQWRLDRLRLAPLTILTIDDLEDLESSVGNVPLLDLLKAYSARVPHRRESLHDFIASSEFESAMRINRSIAAAGRSLLEDAARRVFGRGIGEDTD